jgi:hypothetical protein
MKWVNDCKPRLRRVVIEQPVTSVIAILGSIASIFALFTIFYQANWIYAVCFAIFTLTTFGSLVYLGFQMRRLKVADNLHSLHGFNHCVRDAAFHISEQDGDEKVLDSLRRSLQELAKIFSDLTGRKCRVCIKEVYCDDPSHSPKERAFKVRTLCRDNIEEENADRERSDDYLDRNTDFRELWLDTTMKCFFSNNLTREDYYDNSHWNQNMKRTRTYPYLSTIVWPIRKVRRGSNRTPLNDQERHDTQGFLCVDSKYTYIFDESMDSELGAACADALYTVLRALKTDEDNDNNNKITKG